MSAKDIAVKVAAREGGKINLSIAQIAEAVRHTLAVISELSPPEREKVIAAAAKRERARARKR